jgi:hypothetical protein
MTTNHIDTPRKTWGEFIADMQRERPEAFSEPYLCIAAQIAVSMIEAWHANLQHAGKTSTHEL